MGSNFPKKGNSGRAFTGEAVSGNGSFGALPCGSLLVSFIEYLAYLRNLCAHHSRVWNRKTTKTIKDISKITHIDEIHLEKMIKVLIEVKLVRILK